MNYLPTVGLEVHAQLATKTKIFCGCDTSFGGEPNTHSCPVCLGMPGVLPVLNRRAVELAMRVALCIDGDIQEKSYFARKNYFYPDLPKGYQISMFEFPLIRGGEVTVDIPSGTKRIRINRIHLEEDAGKLVHEEGYAESFFDVNRCGVPLIEIVTEPDFETTAEIEQFLDRLREILVFSGASRGNMFEGNIRVDANISIRPEGQEELGTRTEIKNMNSFTNVVSAVKHEIKRQIDLVRAGGTILQETLLYDPVHDRVSSMRSKEEAHDYRYFPEPDLVPIIITVDWIERARSELPELRSQMRARFEREYRIPAYDAEILTATPAIARYYEDVIATGADSKKASNWIMGEVLAYLNETQSDIEECKIRPDMLATLLGLIEDGTISGSIAKSVFEEMAQNGGDPREIVERKGLTQISDKSELEGVIRKVIAAHPDEVEKYKSGKTKLIAFFVGQVMQRTKGKANPREVNAILREYLS
ncbi:Asp-tRNA(Asn)/Glu-tRNA(Gln) amidotransferase subunit GatB [Candidatus Latescibacterota bacterium]